ncbi:MAG: hypothetical protein RL088_603 [Verrucomicrobiota bacterium]
MKKFYVGLLACLLVSLAAHGVPDEKLTTSTVDKSLGLQDCEKLSLRKLACYSNYYSGRLVEIKEAYIQRLQNDREEAGVISVLISSIPNSAQAQARVSVERRLFDEIDNAAEQGSKIVIKCVGCGYDNDGLPMVKAVFISPAK